MLRVYRITVIGGKLQPGEKPEREQNREWIGVKFELVGDEWLKDWVWYPEMPVIARILQRKAELEDQRYPGGKGRRMLAEYFYKAILGDSIVLLNREYEIPDQIGGQKVKELVL